MYTVLPKKVYIDATIPMNLSPLIDPPGLFACLILNVGAGQWHQVLAEHFRGWGKGQRHNRYSRHHGRQSNQAPWAFEPPEK